jgi:hypothetical protein
MMRSSVPALLLALVAVPGVFAKPLPTLSARRLTIHAQTVVLASPSKPTAPTRFRVLEVFRGQGLKPGDTPAIEPGMHDLDVYQDGMVLPEDRCHVEQALLFLGPNCGTPEQPRFEPVPSGLRFWTREQTLLIPRQVRNPGRYVMVAAGEANWPGLVRQVRLDSAAVDQLQHARDLPPSRQRTRALLAWVERHRHDFGMAISPGRLDGTQGWGELETEVFRWVLESGEPAECWAAVRLYAELNRGAVPPLPGPSFGSPEGQTLLRDIALAGDALEADRVRALGLLADSRTLWAGPLQDHRKVRPLTQKEQDELLDRLVPLLTARSASLRGAAARTIRCVSRPEVVSDEHPPTQRILPALVKAYQAEAPGAARDELAEAAWTVGGPERWQKLSGNSAGVLVLLRDFGRRDDQAYFWLELKPCGRSVHECPTLVLERQGAGKAAKPKEVALPVSNSPARLWEQGWAGGSLLLVQFPVAGLEPGTWRVSVRGTIGSGSAKEKWTAEPKLLVIEAPRESGGKGNFFPFGKGG